MKNILLLLIFLSVANANANDVACDFSPTEQQIFFGEIITGTSTYREVVFSNKGTKSVIVLHASISQVNDVYNLPEDVAFPIQVWSGGNFTINIEAKPNQNVVEHAMLNLIVECENNLYPISLEITANAHFPIDYYKPTFNLYDEELEAALRSIVTDSHKPMTYNAARDSAYTYIDLHNDSLECVYSARKISHKGGRPDIGSTKFNTEHTWPQSYGASQLPALSDMHHFYPSDEVANAQRGNSKFDYVVGSISFQVGGSKLGRNSKDQIKFEVRDAHKGNSARSILYFAIRYDNPQNYLDLEFETICRQWALLDTPDSLEMRRNNLIEYYQGNRNPFVDYPQYYDRIQSISGFEQRESKARVLAAINEVEHNLPSWNKPKGIDVKFINLGNADAILLNHQYDGNINVDVSSLSYLQSGQSGSIYINSTEPVSNIPIRFTFNSGQEIVVNYSSSDLPLSVGNTDNLTLMVYPQPANDLLKIDNIGELNFSTIQVFNSLGIDVSHFTSFTLFDNSLNLNCELLNSGVYTIKIGEKVVKFIVAQ